MLWLDFETFNTRDITVGTYAYAETAEVLIATYAFDDGPVLTWDATRDPMLPADLRQYLQPGTGPITAHNAVFDRNILRSALGIETDIPRWTCTMTQAMAHGFPGGLSMLGKLLKLPDDRAKIKDGRRLILKFCKPAPSNHKLRRYTRETSPDDWQLFLEYAAQDVAAMREVHKRLPDWNWGPEMLAGYHLDQKINDRGFAVDMELVRAGAVAADAEKIRLGNRFRELTGGQVSAPTQRERFRLYIEHRFAIDMPNTQASTLAALIDADDTHPVLRELLEVATSANKTSTAKYKTLLPAVSADGRFRGGLQYCGAARTRRWSGRVFQPHNLPSRGLPKAQSVERYIQALKTGMHDVLFDDLMAHGSAALRGVLVAPEAGRIGVADLSNIEGRANAWLAGEDWKLDAFAAFDRGEGPDLYNVTAGQILGRGPYDVSRTERNVMGKVPELALGYAGGVGAFQQFARAYRIQMTDHWDAIQASVHPRFVDMAAENWEAWGRERNAGGASQAEWIASETVKLAWRDRHPAIVDLWSSCETAARSSIKNPGREYDAGEHLQFSVRRHAGARYLLVEMPSGNYMTYFEPYIEDDTLMYSGTHALTRQWTRLHTYGGKLVENVCQSLSRDILAENMRHVEDAGYTIVLTVHDEVVTQMPPEGTVSALVDLLARQPAWAKGFPLAAAGFETERYRKED